MFEKPLAQRMRPQTLNDVLGQEKIKSFLNKLIESNSLISMILYGKPGTGKSTLAQAFCHSIDVNFISLNAVLDNKAKMEENFNRAMNFYPTIIIIDEIHRLDKGKQDLLLPHLENGDFYLIGCTTANPLISINPAIRSRTRLLETTPLSKDDILIGLNRSLSSENGLNNQRKIEKKALEYIANISGGDLRFAYNQLEAVCLSYSSSHLITLNETKEIAFMSNYFADRNEDEHYDTVSAFQKSIRGSEVDAALYYLAKLIQSGDLEAIIRRLLVTAYEDVGLANPAAVDRCYHACMVAREVGFPEAKIPLAFTVSELSLSPKSKSTTLAIEKAMDNISSTPLNVKDYLRYTRANVDSEEAYPYNEWETLDYLEYLPDDVVGSKFYEIDLKRTGKLEQNLYENYLKRNHKRVSSVKEARALAKKAKN